jgi:zinc protease
VAFPSSQTHILIGDQAIHRGVKDWPALYVGNWILGGGGFASRLTQKVREEKGYVYDISSDMTPMASGGPFVIALQTANKSAQAALDLTLQVTRQFISQGPTQAEVDQAIDHITGSFPLSIASNSDIVGQLGAIGFYDLPTDYLTQFIDKVKKVTPAMVKTAMQEVINPDDFTIVDTGPTALTQPDEHKKK